MVDSTAPPRTADAVRRDDDELITGEAVALAVRPTGFVLRAAGCLIDVLVSAAAFTVVLWVIYSARAVLDEAAVDALVTADMAFAMVVVPVGVETAFRGRSLGRLAIGARIVRDDGGGIRFRHAFVRAVVGVAEIYFTLGGLAALVSLLHPKAKRLGDVLAGTYSQHERVPRFTRAEFDVPVELADWAVVADVAPLPDRLARRVAQFLDHAPDLSPASRQRLATDLANEASGFVHPVPACEPELFLAGVSVLRRRRDAASLARRRRILARLEPVLTALPHGFEDR